MSPQHVRIALNHSTEADIRAHLQKCDDTFTPPLSARVDIADYSRKLRERALTVEAWADMELIGLVAAYLSPAGSSCFVTNVSVLRERSGAGIATRLLSELFAYARRTGLTRIELEVSKASERVRALYSSMGFEPSGERGDFVLMERIQRDAGAADDKGSGNA